MRLRLVWVLFALGVLVAACGGGGKSGVVPATLSNTGGTQPSNAKSTNATMRLYVPPQSEQAAHTKPFYISSSTQAFAIYVEPYPSTLPTGLPSPIPTGVQVFPVVTPSPCAVASGGGESCTFTVTAPIGTDLFVVAALPTTTLTGSTVPLSAFLSGPVAVGTGASPGPLSFTLNGVVYDVAVAVASPDPGNTPNTQFFPAGVPTTAPLAVTAYDANGNAILSSPTQTYFNPIVINASPASEGITLALTASSSCGSSASGATATIACGADLGSVQVSYDGTPHPDASDHLYDSFTIAAPNPAPSPAHVVLQSNVLSWQLVSDASSLDFAYMYTLSNGSLAYLADSEGEFVYAGTFDPSTETGSTPVQNPDGYFDLAVIASDGSLWIANSEGGLDCFSSITQTTTTVSNYEPYSPVSESQLVVSGVGVDTAGNLWYNGYDEDNGYMFAGYFPTSACSAPESTTAQFQLVGDEVDGSDYPWVAAMPNGSVSMQAYFSPSGEFFMSPSPPPEPPLAVPSIAPVNSGAGGNGIASDPGGTLYALFSDGSNGSDLETIPSGGTAFTSILTFPSLAEETPDPDTPSVFSPNGGAADRLAYEDDYFDTLGIVESVKTSPMPLMVELPNAEQTLATAYSTHGGLYVLIQDENNNMDMDRVLGTKTWTALPVLYDSSCSSYGFLSIVERGDSGPFTLSFTGGVTDTPFTGTDHAWELSINSALSSFNVTVTDSGGRTETYTETGTSNPDECGAKKRLLFHRNPRKRKLKRAHLR
ncbi:MAG TPA: hypothetical protein VMA98_11925 [Candidatus Acidoferrales bacterium]|nr:hypothetical protein [Candidatus Acidoferrales bacterium]